MKQVITLIVCLLAGFGLYTISAHGLGGQNRILEFIPVYDIFSDNVMDANECSVKSDKINLAKSSNKSNVEMDLLSFIRESHDEAKSRLSLLKNTVSNNEDGADMLKLMIVRANIYSICRIQALQIIELEEYISLSEQGKEGALQKLDKQLDVCFKGYNFSK